MRVLHINAGNMYGGVETLLATLARCRHLCPEMEQSFALCFEGRVSQELTDANVPVYFLGGVRTSRFWSALQARRRLRRLFVEHKFDVVVTHMSWSHAIFGPEVNRAGLPLVNWVHGVSAGGHWLERWASRTPPKLLICNSRFTANEARSIFRGVAKDVIYYPVAGHVRLRERTAIRRQLGINDDTVVILQASRTERWKGHQLHLQALARLRDLPNWTCWMAGGAQSPREQDYLERLQRQASVLGVLDRIHFLGRRSDVCDLMAGADIFCQPNEFSEPFGIVFVEALSAGTPVVTTRMGAATEIIDESCGILVRPGDVSALAEALERLIQSPEDRGTLAHAGPSRAKILCDPAHQLAKLFQSLEGASAAATRTGDHKRYVYS